LGSVPKRTGQPTDFVELMGRLAYHMYICIVAASQLQYRLAQIHRPPLPVTNGTDGVGGTVELATLGALVYHSI